MDKPIISYHVLDVDDTYMQQSSVYAGTYTGDEALEIKFRIWNNYCGIKDVQNLEHFNLVLAFLTEEDSALLKYVSIYCKHGDQEERLNPIPEHNATVFTFTEPVILSGQANTGSEEDTSNYISITISFNPGANTYLKDHDLKSLILDIVEL